MKKALDLLCSYSVLVSPQQSGIVERVEVESITAELFMTRALKELYSESRLFHLEEYAALVPLMVQVWRPRDVGILPQRSDSLRGMKQETQLTKSISSLQ